MPGVRHIAATRWSEALLWLLSGTVVAAAVSFARVAMQRSPATPIDRALPVVALILFALAWLIRDSPWSPAMQAAPLLLIGCLLSISDERLRLFAYGIVVAAVFCGTTWVLVSRGGMALRDGVPIAIAGIVVLRWLVLREPQLAREAIIAAGMIAILIVSRSRLGAFPLFAALAAAVAPPAIPLRTAAVPLLVALVIALLRLHRLRALDVPAFVALALLLVLFPWSGAVARGLPYFWRVRPAGERIVVAAFLAPGESVTISVPPGGRSLIISGANIPRLREGTVVARIDPGGVPVRIGEIADWGAMRRQHFYPARKVLPRDPAGVFRDYGYEAFIDGAGRVAIPRGADRVRITAEKSLAPDIRIHVEAMEVDVR